MTREQNAQTVSIEQPPTDGMTTKVVKGSVWTLLGQIAPMAVSLITTPFVIRMLGTEGYGVIALISLLPAYLTFVDLGMGMASTKFGSEAFASGDRRKEADVVKTACAIALVVAIPVAVFIFVFSDILTTLLNVPARLHSDASLAFKFASVALVFSLLNNIVNTPQLARLRMDLNTLVNAATRVLGLIAAPIVIYFGGGLAGAVFALMSANLIGFVFHLIVSAKLNPQLFKFSIDKEAVRPLLTFGSAMTLSGVAGVLLSHLEKLVLTKQTSVEQLAFYSVAFAFSNAATLFGVSMAQSIIPAFARLLAPEKRGELTTLFMRTLRISLFGLLPLIAILFVVARPFFTIWAGPAFGSESTLSFYLLLIGVLFNINSYTPGSLILASGGSDLYAKLYWLELGPYVILVAVLTSAYGAVGAAAAWSTRTAFDAIAFFWLAKRRCGISFDLRPLLAKLVLPLIVLSPPIIIAVFFPEKGQLLSVILMVISLGLYAVLMWIHILTGEEKRWLQTRGGHITDLWNTKA